ncbi:MAG: LPP20 family lipoprotein [Bacteroidaceae bacterium]|nr:LPP20 family lipoprotein [Bacteroidaceae bacterium]
MIPFKFIKRGLSVLLLTAASAMGYGQSISPKDWEKIQQNSNYLIGMGTADNLDDARQMAESDLAGKIQTNVQSRFDYVINQQNKGKQVSSDAKMKNIIRSYTAVTLNNVSEYIAKQKPKFVVYRYIKNSEVRAMFKRRMEMAKKWAREAAEREKELKIGDALQDYYWALALLRSCPDGDLEALDGNEKMLPEVFNRVKDILGKVKVNAVSSEQSGNQQRVTLEFTYGGQPTTNFNYRLCNGKTDDPKKPFDSSYSGEIYSAKDGTGELLLPAGAKLTSLKVVAEYEFREEANIHPELSSVLDCTDPVPFNAAVLNVDTKNCATNSQYVMEIASSGGSRRSNGTPQQAQQASSTSSASTNAVGGILTLNAQEATPYINTMKAIEQGISQRSYSGLQGHFTPEGWKMFESLISYGDAKLLRSPQVEFSRDREQVVCRSFPMSFTFKGNRRTFTEDVVFYLDAQAKITEVAFGLEQAAVNDILCRDQWSADARNVMVHFLETYKTAYALKRWDYINTIFSNEALIITGSVVKATGKQEMGPAKVQHVKYTRQTKEEYMASLKRCFQSNEYINIHFADNIVRRSNNNQNIYGIQIKQDYFSSSYGDTGYLFLLIDFADPNAPLIHVRTWQPDKDPNVRDGRIGITDFML